MKKKHYIIVYTTFPNLSVAKRIVRALVRERLCACGNIFRLASIYAWQGKIEENTEYGVLIKTRKENYQPVQRYLFDHHPYEVPAIVSWTIERGSPAYLDWMDASVSKSG